MLRAKVVAALVCALVAAAQLGCDPGASTATGSISYKGKPLPQGTITLTKDAGAIVVSGTIKDGTYSVESVPLGSYQVYVTTPQPSAPPPPGTPSASAAGSGPTIAIPKKYNSPTDSGLTLEVAGAGTKKDFDLQ